MLTYTHDGEEAWHAPAASSVWAPVVRPKPDHDCLYTADAARNLYCTRASDGSVKWREELFGPARSLAARDDTIVTGTGGGKVVTFRDEGVERSLTGNWRTKHPGGMQSLAVAGSGDVLANLLGAGVARLGGGLCAGAVAWHQENPSPHSLLIVSPRRIFSTDRADPDAFDRREESPMWQAGDDFFALPAGADGTIFASGTSDDGGVVAYDAGGDVDLDDTRIGTERWHYDLAEHALAGPASAGDALSVIESDGNNRSRRLVALRAG